MQVERRKRADIEDGNLGRWQDKGEGRGDE